MQIVRPLFLKHFDAIKRHNDNDIFIEFQKFAEEMEKNLNIDITQFVKDEVRLRTI